MENYNTTLKKALNFVEYMEYLQEANKEELGRIRSEMVDLLELQILKNEFIENISFIRITDFKKWIYREYIKVQ